MSKQHSTLSKESFDL